MEQKSELALIRLICRAQGRASSRDGFKLPNSVHNELRKRSQEGLSQTKLEDLNSNHSTPM